MDLNETCLITKEFFVTNINKNFQKKRRQREVFAQNLLVDSYQNTVQFKLVLTFLYYSSLRTIISCYYIIVLWVGTCQVNTKN